jgi:hypothetical protein
VSEEPVLMAEFTAELYLWRARSDSWTFVDLPPELSEEIRTSLPSPPRGFGSVRVEVTVGETTWRTSVFPDKGKGVYVLPVKRAVQGAEQIEAGDEVSVELTVLA